MAVAVEDLGRKGRFEILRRDVERKVLEPLRTHNWVANIEREVGEGEYLIIDAERAGVSHRIAVFYTSATANGAYKQAAAQVEHIFFNGAPYMVESFAHGLGCQTARKRDPGSASKRDPLWLGPGLSR
jgi:hypothetical protein